MKIIFLILLLVLSINIQAENYKRYEFPPLENKQEMKYPNTNQKSQNSMYNGKKQSTYFQQPKYIFPKLDSSRKNTDKYSTYNYPAEEQQQQPTREYNQSTQRNMNSNSYRNTELKPYKNKSYKDYSYRRNRYPDNYYSQSYPNSRYSRPNSYDSYGSNPMNGFSDLYNSYPYSMDNPFSNNGFFDNNGWSPMSNGSSMWPNFNNGMMGVNPSQNYPNIRTPGYFSR